MADLTRKTAQLWNISSWDGTTAQRGILERVTNGYKLTATSSDAYTMTYGSGTYSYSVIGGSEYTLSWTVDNPQIYGVVYIFTGTSVADTPLTTAVASNGSKTFTVPSGHNYVAFRLGVSNAGDEITYTNIMLNEGSTPLPYEPYYPHSLRKLTTATEAVENPLYSDGTAITSYTIKGNTVQNGTPTPSNPVEVNGVGVRTENLAYKIIENANISAVGLIATASGYNVMVAKVAQGQVYSGTGYVYAFFNDEPDIGSTSYNESRVVNIFKNVAAPISGYVAVRYGTSEDSMINEGSTALPYEPYGYKIPISNGQQTTNIYISAPLQKLYTYSDDLQSDGTITRNIGKVELTGEETVEYISNYGQFKIQTSYYRRPPYVETSYLCTHYKAISNAASWAGDNYITVSQGDTPDRFYRIKDSRYSTAEDFKTYLAQQYANGTPVTIYFVKAAATTETITAPTIPTTEGANSITVDTTVQPSEFTATWTGWHDATVKEWDGSDWN